MKITAYSKVFLGMLVLMGGIMSCERTTVAIKGEALTVSRVSWWVWQGDVKKIAASDVKSIEVDKRKNERSGRHSPSYFWHIVCALKNGEAFDAVQIVREKPAQKFRDSMEKGIAQNSLRLRYFHNLFAFLPVFCMVLFILCVEILHVCFTGRSLEDNKKKWDAQKS